MAKLRRPRGEGRGPATGAGGRVAPPDVELEALFDLSLALLCIADAEGYFQRVNPAFEKTLGYSRQELLARPFLEFVHPEDRPATLAEMEKLARGLPTVAFENRYCCRDGAYRWLSWKAMPEARGRKIYAVATDVTERKRAEERFRQLFELAPDGLVLVDGAGRIDLVNAQAERMLGYTREELAGQEVEVLVPGLARQRHAAERQAYMARPRVRAMGTRGDLFCLRKDGSEFAAEISLSPVQTAEGTMVCAAIRDVTARREAQRKIQENTIQMLAAQHIQERLLPDRAPLLAGFDIAGASYPAEYAGGDAFDFLGMGREEVGLLISDVMGHGIAAALLMASTHAYVRSLAHTTRDLGEILRLANRILMPEIDPGRFVTVLLARLEARTRTVAYCSAGHPTGFVLGPTGRIKARLASGAMPLGIARETRFPRERVVRLAEGDTLLLVTDGILEERSPEEEQFGQRRMLDVVGKHRHQPAREIIAALHRAVLDFGWRAQPRDDVTAVVVKVMG